MRNREPKKARQANPPPQAFRHAEEKVPGEHTSSSRVSPNLPSAPSNQSSARPKDPTLPFLSEHDHKQPLKRGSRHPQNLPSADRPAASLPFLSRDPYKKNNKEVEEIANPPPPTHPPTQPPTPVCPVLSCPMLSSPVRAYTTKTKKKTKESRFARANACKSPSSARLFAPMRRCADAEKGLRCMVSRTVCFAFHPRGIGQ